jgi:hypothetical protein
VAGNALVEANDGKRNRRKVTTAERRDRRVSGESRRLGIKKCHGHAADLGITEQA